MTNLTLFSQIISTLDRSIFRKLVKEKQTEKHQKGYNSWAQLIAMLFCQFANSQSVRDFSNGLRSATGNLKVCSADTIGRVQKSLARPKEVHISKAGIEHHFSHHDKHDHSTRDHHSHELGVVNTVVYFIKGKEVHYGLHLHYLYILRLNENPNFILTDFVTNCVKNYRLSTTMPAIFALLVTRSENPKFSDSHTSLV